MEVKRTIKTEVESFELGDVISFKLKDGEKVQAKAVKKTDEGMRVPCCMGLAPGWLKKWDMKKLSPIF